jgi:hypothetical protein
MKTEHVNIDIHQKIVTRTCADSLDLPDGFVKLECPMGCKIQMIG